MRIARIVNYATGKIQLILPHLSNNIKEVGGGGGGGGGVGCKSS